MTNEEKAKMIADQCKPCSEDFYSGIEQGVLLALNAESETKKYPSHPIEFARWILKHAETHTDKDGMFGWKRPNGEEQDTIQLYKEFEEENMHFRRTK